LREEDTARLEAGGKVSLTLKGQCRCPGDVTDDITGYVASVITGDKAMIWTIRPDGCPTKS
jgi:hypothetical protein